MADTTDAPQTPEEIAEITAANKARSRNINKLTAILVAICLVGLGIFLAVFISLHQNQSTGDTSVKPQATVSSISSDKHSLGSYNFQSDIVTAY